MTYFIKTFGCQMNKSDSERIAFVLEKIGYQKAKNINQADLVIINMCSVRQSAVDRVYGLISKLKIENSKLKIFVTGCILPSDKRKFQNKVDLIFNIKDLPKLSENLGIKSLNLPKNYLEIPALYSSSFSAYVPIMTGCNNFCTYCVVPYTRGPEYSRLPALILKEIRDLLKKGYKRIILLGQNVNSYQRKTKNETVNFCQLLKKIASLPGNFWLSFITSHPKDLSDQLITTVFSSKKICKYFHLPVQSGSDKILKKMNRGYTMEKYKKIIKKIKEKAKHKNEQVAISTDIIVGFPGETKKDFQKTVSLLKKIKYDMVYIAKYSPRPLTAAFYFKDNIDSIAKEARKKELMKILKETALLNNKKYLNKIVKVLVIGYDQKKYLYGETSTFKKVRIVGVEDRFGKVHPVKSRKAGATKSLFNRVNPVKSAKAGTVIPQFSRVKITSVSPWGLTGLFC